MKRAFALVRASDLALVAASAFALVWACNLVLASASAFAFAVVADCNGVNACAVVAQDVRANIKTDRKLNCRIAWRLCRHLVRNSCASNSLTRSDAKLF
jgi:hypothetical protein